MAFAVMIMGVLAGRKSGVVLPLVSGVGRRGIHRQFRVRFGEKEKRSRRELFQPTDFTLKTGLTSAVSGLSFRSFNY